MENNRTVAEILQAYDKIEDIPKEDYKIGSELYEALRKELGLALLTDRIKDEI